MQNRLPLDFTLERYGLHIRFVNESDAEFIVGLRTNPNLAQFLSKVKDDVLSQKGWILEYKKKEKIGLEYYFLFLKNETKLGVCRIYNIQETSFTLGSWVFSPKSGSESSVVGNIITRELAYEIFPKKELRFDVRKGNHRVLRYHKNYNPTLIDEDDLNYYYSLSKECFETGKLRILKLLNII